MDKFLKFIWDIKIYLKRNIENKLMEYLFIFIMYVGLKSMLDF